jgi:hypothetical protein
VQKIHAQGNTYSWKTQIPASLSLSYRVKEPEGYKRIASNANSFPDWLRHIPVKAGRPDVLLYNGDKKGNQQAHHLVLDIDTGTKDLQQCADAVIRLRAEYLYATDQQDEISFNFTNGFKCDFRKWSQGYRPQVKGNQVTWAKVSPPDSGYASFKKYLQTIFIYSGTQSLSSEMKPKTAQAIKPGDVFIRGGFPGHAVIVMDVAIHSQTGERIFLLAQSYMPAQDIHILVNPRDPEKSPWYSVNFSEELFTPEWIFKRSELKEF